MSFGNNSGMGMLEGSSKECKPDYEAKAARLKIKLDSINTLNAALLNFLKTNEGYRFEKISSLAEMLGGLVMVREELNRLYEELLERLEKEK